MTIIPPREHHGLKQLGKDYGTLLGGVIPAQLLGALTLAMTARALGPASLGLLVLVQSYVLIVAGTIKFQSWQAIIQFGASRIGEPHSLARLSKFGFILDLSTAIFGTLVAPVVLWGLVKVFSWPSETLLLGSVACIVILFDWAGTASGILRLSGDFRSISVQRVAMAAARFAGAGIAWALGTGTLGFVIAWAIGTAGETLLMAVVARRKLTQLGCPPFRAVRIRGVRRENPGVLSFALSTNLATTLSLIATQVDTLIVAGTAGFAATGIFKVSKQLCAVLGKICEPLYHAIYPSLVRTWSDHQYREFRRLVIVPSLWTGAISVFAWVATVIFGAAVLVYLFGSEYRTGYDVLVWLVLGLCIAIAAFPLNPAILAMGRADVSLGLQVVTTGVYLTVVVILTRSYGVVGAGVASVVYFGLWSVLAWIYLWNALNSALTSAQTRE